MAYRKWIIADADKEKASFISEKFNIDPFVSFLLASRGIDNELAVSDFLSDTIKLFDPFCLKDMDKAVERINRAIDNGERITVYGDYDCDGITSTVLLYSFLSSLGADADYYIPSRESEGYGLNKDAIKNLCEKGTRLIVTVDNGISAFDEAEYIYSLGMELVVTDHHSVSDRLPRAEAVVNPHRKDNEACFEDLAGVGVAFKLACALYGDAQEIISEYADLAALGTIADIVPLVSENRCIVKAGLKLINSSSRAGISALKNASGFFGRDMTSTDVVFVLAPRINATGRIESASKSVELLLQENYDIALEEAQNINLNNSHRQELEAQIFADVKRQIDENPALASTRVIVVSGKNYHQGVVGIVAARVLEEYAKPVIVIGVDEDNCARGSARSIDGFNIFEAISACSDMLEHFGGHPKAAGLSLSADKIDEFRSRINDYAAQKYPVMPAMCLNVDAKMSPFYLNVELAKALSVMEPYGECNKKAVFALFGLNLLSVSSIGGGKHIKIECEKNSKRIRIVKFGVTESAFPFKSGDKIDAAVRIGINLYNSKEYLSVQAVDIRKSGIDEDRFFAEKADYELFLLGKKSSPSLYPSRDVCSVIYKYLRNNKDKQLAKEDIYFQLSGVTYGQLMFALDAFEECSLIKINGNRVEFLEVNSRVDLMNTEVIKTLKGRLGLD